MHANPETDENAPKSRIKALIDSLGAIVKVSIGISLLAGISGLPARLEEISNFSKDGFKPHEYLAAAMFRDININLIFFIGGWLLVWSVLLAHHLFKTKLTFRKLFLVLAPYSLAVALAEFMGSEFRVERGIYPSWFDVKNAQGGSGVGMAYLKLAIGGHVLVGWLLLIATVAGITYWIFHNHKNLRRIQVLILSVALLGGISDQCRTRWIRISPHLPSIMSARVTESPFAAFVRRRTNKSTNNGFYGVVALLQGLDTHEARQAKSGLSLLGLDPQALERLRHCDPGVNPLREEFSTPLGGSESSTQLLKALGDLSSALFDHSEVPVHLYHILVETFLAGDFSSMGSELPKEAIPFWNNLIEESSSKESSTIVARDMRQAGVRTSQAISASFCGLGTLPHLLSMGRDLQEIPLRCIPEVLRDAGFLTEMHHGYLPEFDLRTQFFQARKMDFWHIRRIPGAKDGLTAFWDGDIGLSDNKLVDFSLKRSAELPDDSSTYIGMLTLSSHRPFRVPGDFKPEDRNAAEAILAKLPPEVSQRPLSQDRIRVLRYVDRSLRTYIEGISKLPKTSRSITIAIGYGDHSHSEADLFGGIRTRTPSENLAMLSRIPFFIHIFPESLRDHPEREKVLKAVRRLNALLGSMVISQNDIPRIILALLSHSKELQDLPKPLRWHTLGGQRLSPFSTPPESTQEGVVWGVDGKSDAFVIDTGGVPLATETQSSLDEPEVALKPGLFQPATQALSLMIKHTLEVCPSQTLSKDTTSQRTE